MTLGFNLVIYISTATVLYPFVTMAKGKDKKLKPGKDAVTKEAIISSETPETEREILNTSKQIASMDKAKEETKGGKAADPGSKPCMY